MNVTHKTFDQERALYGVCGAQIADCAFDGPADGESALKETANLALERCYFNLRYPLWHARGAELRGCEMTGSCRAAMWYDEEIALEDCRLHGVKALRECRGVWLRDCGVRSPEFAWKCRGLRMERCKVESEYPFFECADVEAAQLELQGKYSFQYVENAVIRDSRLCTKDAFWHSRNVTVVDSLIEGENLGWYSQNLRLVRCRIVGTQPLCYCKGLVLEDCAMERADLAFEYSEVRATVRGHIESVKNPLCGSICSGSIGETIWDAARVDPQRTLICCGAAAADV
jgi:hypothetical protein